MADPSLGAGTTGRRVTCLAPEDRTGRICRDCRTTAAIEGREQEIYGIACRRLHGS
jgi:surface antigen